jgi:hypothetical protein
MVPICSDRWIHYQLVKLLASAYRNYREETTETMKIFHVSIFLFSFTGSVLFSPHAQTASLFYFFNPTSLFPCGVLPDQLPNFPAMQLFTNDVSVQTPLLFVGVFESV